MSLKDIQNRIDELFTDNSSIYEIKMTSNENYFFIVNDIKYVVKIIPMHTMAEIIFYYLDEKGFQQTTPTGLKENQFKIINTVVECVKLLVKNTDGKYDQYDFSGNIKNGLAKIYSLIGKKLKNSLEGYSFSEDKSLHNYYFSITKKDELDELFTDKKTSGDLKSIKEQSHGGDIMSNKNNLKESTSVNIINADGSSITITSDDINELTQIMKNAGLAMPIQPTNDDLSIETDGDVELDIVDYEDEYLNQPKDSVYDNEIPAYALVSDEDEYCFDLGDTGYDIDYEDPYGDLSDVLGYVEEDVDELSEEIIVSISGNITKSLTKSIVNWCNNYDGNINLISVSKSYPSKTIFKIKCSDEITAEEFISDFEQNHNGDFHIESNSIISEVAELNASVPYDEDAEESGFNIKGTAHQSDLRYVPGMAADNPMVDELREGLDNEFENELEDAISYCRDEIDESDMLDALQLGQAGPIDVKAKQILISKLANYLYSRYANDIANGNTALTPNNFEGMASYMFEDNLWHILQDEGFYWSSNND